MRSCKMGFKAGMNPAKSGFVRSIQGFDYETKTLS